MQAAARAVVVSPLSTSRPAHCSKRNGHRSRSIHSVDRASAGRALATGGLRCHTRTRTRAGDPPELILLLADLTFVTGFCYYCKKLPETWFWGSGPPRRGAISANPSTHGPEKELQQQILHLWAKSTAGSLRPVPFFCWERDQGTRLTGKLPERHIVLTAIAYRASCSCCMHAVPHKALRLTKTMCTNGVH